MVTKHSEVNYIFMLSRLINRSDKMNNFKQTRVEYIPTAVSMADLSLNAASF